MDLLTGISHSDKLAMKSVVPISKRGPQNGKSDIKKLNKAKSAASSVIVPGTYSFAEECHKKMCFSKSKLQL